MPSKTQARIVPAPVPKKMAGAKKTREHVAKILPPGVTKLEVKAVTAEEARARGVLVPAYEPRMHTYWPNQERGFLVTIDDEQGSITLGVFYLLGGAYVTHLHGVDTKPAHDTARRYNQGREPRDPTADALCWSGHGCTYNGSADDWEWALSFGDELEEDDE